MADYKQLFASDGSISGNILRVIDQAFIPDDPANRDRQTYNKWLADGNTPDPANSPIVPTSIPASEFLARFTQAELLAMHTEANTNASIDVGITQTAAAAYIELAPQTRSAALLSWMDLLVGAGVITAQRAAEIVRPPEPATPLPA